MKRFVFMGALLAVNGLNAHSLGVVGEVFLVGERSLLEFIEEKLKEAPIQDNLVRHIDSQFEHPKALNLPRATESVTHVYCPEITLHQSLFGFNRGITINALERMPNYQPHWVFLNSDDNCEVQWAIKELNAFSAAKIILTGGSIKTTETLFRHDIYFDQGGRLTHQLGITHVPAKVTRQGNVLLVEEIAMKEKEHVA